MAPNAKVKTGNTYPRHDNSTDPVIVKYKDEFYDMSLFYEVHPGGAGHIKLRRNKEISHLLDGAPHPHTALALKWMQQFKVTDPSVLATLPIIDKHGVNWDKGLLFRIHKIKHYVEWIDEPVHRPLRLFDSDLLEFFTVTPWYAVPIVWIPVSLWALNNSFIENGFSVSVMLFFAGIVLWTLLEYTLHNYLFHMEVADDAGYFKKLVQFALHGQHHKNPFDPGRLVFPPLPCAIIVLMLYSTFRIIIPKNLAWGILSGALIGYVIYDLMHYYLHHGYPTKKGSYIWKLRQHHNRHHFDDYSKGLGISNFFWDDLFNTNYPNKDEWNGINFKVEGNKRLGRIGIEKIDQKGFF